MNKRSDSLDAEKFVHPLLVAQIARRKADVLVLGGKGEELIKLAEKLLVAVRDIPPEPAFQPDRAWLLTTVGDITHRAVSVKHGPIKWSKCYDPRADFGIRVLDCFFKDKSGEYDVSFDPDGDARALRAWLLFQRGLHDESFLRATAVSGSRRWDPTTNYNLARINGYFAARPENTTKAKFLEDATKALKRALLAGHENLALKEDDDLSAIRKDKGMWDHFTKPELHATLEAVQLPNGQWRYILGLENRSPFPITTASLAYKLKDSNGKNVSPQFGSSIDYLAPQSTFLWDLGVLSGTPVPGSLGVGGQVGREVKVQAGKIVLHDLNMAPFLETSPAVKDLFKLGAAFTGKHEGLDWTLSIKTRDKEDFTGEIMIERPKQKKSVTYPITGTTKGGEISFTTDAHKIDKFNQTFKGKITGEIIKLTFSGTTFAGDPIKEKDAWLVPKK